MTLQFQGKKFDMNALDALGQHTTIVADTGDFHQLQQYQPQDATTNPSLILKAAQKPDYAPMVQAIVQQYRAHPLECRVDALLVAFGCEILSIIPGRVSTEVDARLSFDTLATVMRAEQILALYQARGIDTRRVLIKIAATWEGIAAARILQARGVDTNLTLLFALPQAIACADAGVKLISPFVGRIYDWHKARAGSAWDEAAQSGLNDPGVQSLQAIYRYYKHFGISTEMMGASFRNMGQIMALSGCDLLTISPELLAQLKNTDAGAFQEGGAPALCAQADATPGSERIVYDEAAFRFALNQDAMATEKLAEGIRSFVSDGDQLMQLLSV